MSQLPWILQAGTFITVVLGVYSIGRWVSSPRQNAAQFWRGAGLVALAIVLATLKHLVQ